MDTPSRKPDPVEPIIYLLFTGVILFTAVLIFVQAYFKDNSSVFQVIAGLLTGFSAALFGRMKPGQSRGTDNSTNVTDSTVIQPPAPQSEETK